MKTFLENYWNDVAEQNETELAKYFAPDAVIRWHNSNESFTVPEFILANCKYPGKWAGTIKRIEQMDDLLICVAQVTGEGLSFHVNSFFRMQNGQIASLDEYWGEDDTAPEWRQKLHIGRAIQ